MPVLFTQSFMQVTLVPRQAPWTCECLRAQITLVVAHACVRGHVTSEVISGQTTLSTYLAPTGVAADVCGLVAMKDVLSRKAPTTQ